MCESALLAAIEAEPDNDLPRLIYADWLEEHGQAERAEFIRLQCELAQMPLAHPERPHRHQRAEQLLYDHELRWLGEWNRARLIDWRFDRGMLDTIEMGPRPFLWHGQELLQREPVRRLRLNGPYGEGVAAEVIPQIIQVPHFARIRGLDLSNSHVLNDWVRALSALTLQPHLEELNLRGQPPLRDAEILLLTNSPAFARLRSLQLPRLGTHQRRFSDKMRQGALATLNDLRWPDPEEESAERSRTTLPDWLWTRGWKRLDLSLRGSVLVDASARLRESPLVAEALLLRATATLPSGRELTTINPRLPRLAIFGEPDSEATDATACYRSLTALEPNCLESLTHHAPQLTRGHFAALASLPTLGSLGECHLHSLQEPFRDDDIAPLVEASWFSQLSRLSLIGFGREPSTARRLADAPSLARLEELRVGPLTDPRPLLRSPWLRGNLTGLGLEVTSLSAAVAEQLAYCEGLRHLRWLDLKSGSVISGAVMRTLWQAPVLQRLTHLTLGPVDGLQLAWLANTPGLPRLRRLDLVLHLDTQAQDELTHGLASLRCRFGGGLTYRLNH